MRFRGAHGTTRDGIAQARRVVCIATLALIGGCSSVSSTAGPAAAGSPRGTAALPTPVSVATPSASPSTPALEGASLEVHCGGGIMAAAIHDYTNEARGVTDILAATRALQGVAATDLVVRDGDSTVVIRHGQAIWRGDWSDMGRGFLLDQSRSCEGVQIGG